MQQPTTHPTFPCPYCQTPAKLVSGRKVYPHRSDLASLKLWECPECLARTTCHKNSDKPMGRLANAVTRRLKVGAHAAFDPIWKSGFMTRTEAYSWLQKVSGLTPEECHMGLMPDNHLIATTAICLQFRKQHNIEV